MLIKTVVIVVVQFFSSLALMAETQSPTPNVGLEHEYSLAIVSEVGSSDFCVIPFGVQSELERRAQASGTPICESKAISNDMLESAILTAQEGYPTQLASAIPPSLRAKILTFGIGCVATAAGTILAGISSDEEIKDISSSIWGGILGAAVAIVAVDRLQLRDFCNPMSVGSLICGAGTLVFLFK